MKFAGKFGRLKYNPDSRCKRWQWLTPKFEYPYYEKMHTAGMNKMKYLFLLVMITFSISASAQILQPASWSFKASKANPAVGETINVIFTATIDKAWYMYSSRLSVEGPMPTSATFTDNNSFETVGDLIPIKPKQKYDEIWGGNVDYFTSTAIFVQKVKVLKANPTVAGQLTFQTCTIKDGSCIPGKEKFKLSL